MGITNSSFSSTSSAVFDLSSQTSDDDRRLSGGSGASREGYGEEVAGSPAAKGRHASKVKEFQNDLEIAGVTIEQAFHSAVTNMSFNDLNNLGYLDDALAHSLKSKQKTSFSLGFEEGATSYDAMVEIRETIRFVKTDNSPVTSLSVDLSNVSLKPSASTKKPYKAGHVLSTMLKDLADSAAKAGVREVSIQLKEGDQQYLKSSVANTFKGSGITVTFQGEELKEQCSMLSRLLGKAPARKYG